MTGITTLICLFIGEIIFIKNNKKMELKIVRQVLFIMGSILLFFIAALLSDLSNKELIWFIILDAVVIIPFFIALVKIYINKKNTHCNKLSKVQYKIKTIFSKFRYEILIVLITFVSRIWQLDTVQKWDSEEYYYYIMQACDNFNFTLGSFFEEFMLIAHPSHAYGFWTGIGAFLFPRKVEGILVITLILTCAANVKLYHLFKKYWINMTQKQAFLGVILCTFLPLYWGAFSYIMPDYLLVCFLIFMLDADANEEWIMFFFWSIMACFSKEIGIVMVCCYFAMKVLCKFILTNGNLKNRIKVCLKTPQICIGLLDGFIILCYILKNEGISSWKHSVYYSNPISWSESSETLYNSFGIQKDNIITRLEEYFIVNFAWILSAILLIGIIIYIVKKKSTIRWTKLAETIALLFGYGIFMCLYITSGAIRYNLAFSVLFPVVVYIILIDITPPNYLME